MPRSPLWRGLLLVLLATAPWLPLLSAPLMLDERVLAFEARKWIGLDPLAPFQLPVGGSGSWRPLVVYLYWLDSWFSPIGRHATNLVLHVAATLLLQRWLRFRLSAVGAFLGAAWFAVHPAHVATAGWVAGRADALMVVFVLAALVSARRSAGLAAVLALAAVLSKETGVVVAALVFLDREGTIPRAAASIAVAAVVGGVASLLIAVPGAGYLPSATEGFLAAVRWAPLFAVEVVAPTFVPAGVPAVLSDTVGFVVALAVIAGLSVRLGRVEQRALAMALLALAPVAHVLGNDGGQWYLLLPSAFVALAWGKAAEAKPRAVLALVLVLAAVSAHESTKWEEASSRVDEQLEEVRAGATAPGAQVPTDWPHRGPSWCCGVPFQLLEPEPETLK